MMDEKKRLEDIFSNAVNEPKQEESFAKTLSQKYSFRAIHNNITSSIMNQIIAWIFSCFNKYNEREFHIKMAARFNYKDQHTGRTMVVQGFDFIGDWNTHHRQRYNTIIRIIKTTKTKLDKQKLLESTITAIQNHGWQVAPSEVQTFRFTIQRLYNILYFGMDSIAEFR